MRFGRALARARPGACVALLADDPLARVDVPHFARAGGHELVSLEAGDDGALRFLVRRGDPAATTRPSPALPEADPGC